MKKSLGFVCIVLVSAWLIGTIFMQQEKSKMQQEESKWIEISKKLNESCPKENDAATTLLKTSPLKNGIKLEFMVSVSKEEISQEELNDIKNNLIETKQKELCNSLKLKNYSHLNFEYQYAFFDKNKNNLFMFSSYAKNCQSE
jgi:hypothetical protein